MTEFIGQKLCCTNILFAPWDDFLPLVYVNICAPTNTVSYNGYCKEIGFTLNNEYSEAEAAFGVMVLTFLI